MSAGCIDIVGLGPGDNALITADVNFALEQASDIIGYIPYVKRIAPRKGLTLHASDNRVEINRAEHAFELALQGGKVVVVSSGDPGVFAMAAAIFEALENGPDEWKNVRVNVRPGITAMLAASARIGAPLGHDFCAINLSDNLKHWSVLENRVRMAARGDFAMAFYNPRSKSRPHQFGQILQILREECESERLIIFARNVSLADEAITHCTLANAHEEMADMRTLVIVGNAQTRQIDGTRYIYSPRGSK